MRQLTYDQAELKKETAQGGVKFNNKLFQEKKIVVDLIRKRYGNNDLYKGKN